MEVNWFLKERTQYIRRFYITSVEGFVEIKRKIDAHESPFVPPPGFDEHGRNIETDEPAFSHRMARSGPSDTNSRTLVHFDVGFFASSLFRDLEEDVGATFS
jgi:hypothetical protein